MTYSRAKRDEIMSWIKEVLDTPIKGKIIDIPIDKLEVSRRATNVLSRAGIATISDFILHGPTKLCIVRNTGKKTICEIGNAVKKILASDIIEKFSYENTKKPILQEETNRLDNIFKELIYNQKETGQDYSKKKILMDADRSILQTSLDEFEFSTRLYNILKTANLRTIEDVLAFGFNTRLQKRKNLGVKSLNELKEKISNFIKKKLSHNINNQQKKSYTSLPLFNQSETKNEESSFETAIKNIISCPDERQLQIIKARYGYEDGQKKTLEQIGNQFNITRERVRQIIVKSHKYFKHPIRKTYFQEILEHIEYSLLHNRGVVSVKDLSQINFFSTGTKKQLRFLLNLIADLYEERYRVIEKKFFTSLNDDEFKRLSINIDEAAFKCHFPIDKNDFYQEIKTAIGTISKDYLYYFLIHKKHIEISDEKVLSPGKLSVSQRIKLFMRDIDKPLHYTEIAKRYKNHFGDSLTRHSSLERLIHARLDYSEDFIIVGPGTFIVRDKFKIPDNIDEIVETSKEILRGLNNISDTKYLIEKLKQRRIELGSLNAYSLKPVLLLYPGFVSYRKFEIGLEEFAEKYERKSLSDLIYDVLLKAGKPLHSKEIWKQLSKHRGFPMYTIEQRLCDEQKFIRLAPSIYTVKENIDSYDEKYKFIIDFATEWINIKEHAVSAFFVNEVLKTTEQMTNLSIGLVEHVLATSPEFKKVSNGFYDLVKK